MIDLVRRFAKLIMFTHFWAPSPPMVTRSHNRQAQPPFCAAALSLLLLSQPSAAATRVIDYQGPARVVDGDTLVVTDGSGGAHRVRLYGVDAPETKQSCTLQDGTSWPCGIRAGEALREHIGSHSVHCTVVDTDRYGRDVGLCDTGTERPLNSWLVENGWALAYKQYGGAQFADKEAKAKRAGAGVWSGTLTQPWEWRKEQRTGGL